jgi:hypothetical protein
MRGTDTAPHRSLPPSHGFFSLLARILCGAPGYGLRTKTGSSGPISETVGFAIVPCSRNAR